MENMTVLTWLAGIYVANGLVHLVLGLLEFRTRKAMNEKVAYGWEWNGTASRLCAEDRRYEREIRDSVPLETRKQIARLGVKLKIKESADTERLLDRIESGELEMKLVKTVEKEK